LYTSKPSVIEDQNITPPSSFLSAPPTPPPTDEKAFPQTTRVLSLFKDIEVGKQIKVQPWIEFQLAPGEYDEIERRLKRDESLFGYVEDKIRYVRSKTLEAPANRADMTTMEKVIGFSFACRPAYMNSSSMGLRMLFEAS
jgi:hypothetical protein